MAGYWAGHVRQQDELLNFMATQQIGNVLFVSGDTHVNTLDDGTNAGIPEVNASGMSVVEGDKQLLYYLNVLAPVLGYPRIDVAVWNRGGTGLTNQDYKNGFGTIEVFGNDSLQVCVVDEDGVRMSCMTVLPYTVAPVSVPTVISDDEVILRLVPNPAYRSVELWLEGGAAAESGTFYLYDVMGRLLYTQQATGQRTRLSLDEYPSGAYFVQYRWAGGITTSVLVHRPAK
jgi:hypothetical protein